MSKPSLITRLDLVGKSISCNGHEIKIGAPVAKGTFCYVFRCIAPETLGPASTPGEASTSASSGCAVASSGCAVASSLPIVIKVFRNMRQFRRTVRAISAIDRDNGSSITDRNYIERILGIGSITIFNAQCNVFDMVPYVLLPYCEIRLKDFINQYVKQYERGLPALATLTITRQLFQALDCLERAHVVHGDLKPGNIMIRAPPVFDDSTVTSFDTVLCDFGSARLMDPKTRACNPACVGTDSFIAPEIMLGLPYTSHADIWSAMVTVFYIITGDKIFNVFNDNDLDYGIDLRGIVLPLAEEESESSEDHEMSITDDDTSNGGDYDTNAADDIDFATFYAFTVLMYKLLGKPPEAFCALAADYYYNGIPRYHPNLIPSNIQHFFGINYHNLNRNAMLLIEEFLLLGLQYMDTDRSSASTILTHRFLSPLQLYDRDPTSVPITTVPESKSPAARGNSKKQKKKHNTRL